MILIAFVPLVIVGIVLNFQYWRRSRLRSISIQQPLASSD
jgi:hypothetical protein